MTLVKPHSENYYLDIKFGAGKSTTKNPSQIFKMLTPIDELYIIQDMHRFLPTFRLKMQDLERYYSNLFPFDERQHKLQIMFNRNSDVENSSVFEFDILRRYPSSDSLYDISGVLQIDNLFKPGKVRGFSGNVRDNLITIAAELGITETDISSSLDFDQNFIQPSWSNSKLLKYLRDNLIGNQDVAGYFCYIIPKQTLNGMKKVFVFKSLEEFYKQKVKYTFSDTPTPAYDNSANTFYYPILDYKAFDNRLLETNGCRKLDYDYYDYDTGVYALDSVDIEADKFYSLTEYFAIDQNSPDDNVSTTDQGRSNDFTPDFKGINKSLLFKKINDFSKIWITTWGLEDIYLGDIVRLQFFKDITAMVSHQYHGFWMVERIVHVLGEKFGTRLLLTRNGINTTSDTMLLEASVRK